MLRITLICLGKLKEAYWRSAEAEYLKRLSPFAKIEIKELKEESFDEKSDRKKIREKEAGKIIAALPKGESFIVVLDEHGHQLSSADLAGSIKDSEITSPTTFIIGGPLGLDESILKLATLKLSLSSFTFTHQMARVILLEQIYRAMMIAGGRKYHN